MAVQNNAWNGSSADFLRVTSTNAIRSRIELR
jgi:hypothetical protein